MSSDVVAFVGGATGYVGRSVVEELRRGGARTIGHVRPDSPKVGEWRARWEAEGVEVDTTAWDDEAMAARFAELRPTHVFALLGTTARRAKGEGRTAIDAYEAIDYGLTMILVRAAEAAPSRPRVVYLSAAGLREEEPSNAYMNVRWRVEKELRERALPFTIVRPSFITGDDRDESRPAERIGAAVADGLLAVVGALGGARTRDRYASMTGRELARGIVRVALDPAKVGAIVHGDGLRTDA
jgi:nucleoside-diphosphate-sugar epimerase